MPNTPSASMGKTFPGLSVDPYMKSLCGPAGVQSQVECDGCGMMLTHTILFDYQMMVRR